MTDLARLDAISTLVDAAAGGESTLPDAVSGALASLGIGSVEAGALADSIHRHRRDNARLRRREHELSALFSSARELAEQRDGDAVLARLVQRAFEMMGVDLAYLSEFDATTRELRVRETSGAVSARFQTLRVPPGQGLASAVVETRAPQWAAHYAQYARNRHDQQVDAAVADEGLVSVLGVPMLSGAEVLGVLFVANRHEHTFTPEEIALLSALADHASVVLQTARTLRDLRTSEDEARRTLAQLTDHLAERERAHSVHQRLVHAVLAGGGFAPVAETLAEALDRPVAIVDPRGRTLSVAGGEIAAGDAVSEAVREAVVRSRASGQCVTIDQPGIAAVAALTAGTQHFGALLIGPGGFQLGAVDRRTIERAAQVGALLSFQQEALAGADHRMQSELITDLLDDVPERRLDVERRARRLGVVPHRLDSLLLLAVQGEARASAARALSGRLGEHALIGEHQGYIVAAYASDGDVDPAAVRQSVSAAIESPVLAITPPIAAGSLPAVFPAVVRTARLLVALEIDDVAVEVDDYLPYAVALDADQRSLATFLDATIGPVRRYDTERGADLLGTLRAFVRQGGSPTRTARALTFHPNTILQRLERLDHVLGEDWRDDERLFRIGLAVRLDELRERLTRSADSAPARS